MATDDPQSGLLAADRMTGAVHAAAFCRADGAIQVLRENIGRHTARDKAIGAAARAALRPNSAAARWSPRCRRRPLSPSNALLRGDH